VEQFGISSPTFEGGVATPPRICGAGGAGVVIGVHYKSGYIHAPTGGRNNHPLLRKEEI